MTDQFSIVAAAACTPVGPTLAQTAASIELGVAGLREHPTVHSGDLQPRALGTVPGISEVGAARYPWLARLALADLWEQLDALDAGARQPVFIAVAPDRATASVRAALKHDLEAEFALKVVKTDAFGPSSALELIAKCARLHPNEPFVVGAVDSFIDTERLKAVAPRLYSSETKTGFIGGEAAVFLCVAPADQVRRYPHCLQVSRVCAAEVSLAPSDFRPSGLDQVLDKLTADLPPRSLDWWASDINGERYRARAYGQAISRVAISLRHVGAHRTTTYATGDVGTATSALQLAVAYAQSRETAGGSGLVLCSAFSGTAAGCLVTWKGR